jgi:hypothetical protein
MISRPASEPRLDLGGFVGGIVVHDNVDIEPLGDLSIDLFEEVQELGRVVATPPCIRKCSESQPGPCRRWKTLSFCSSDSLTRQRRPGSLLSDYDVVLNSQDKVTLEKSLKVLKQGGKLISISGLPDPRFAREQRSSWMIEQVLRVLSSSIRRKANRRSVNYSFLFMRANGAHLSEITSLTDAGVIRPVMDRVFPFASTNEAIAYVEAGRAKGKVVVKVR